MGMDTIFCGDVWDGKEVLSVGMKVKLDGDRKNVETAGMNVIFVLEFYTGAGVVKSHGKTAGVGRMTTIHPAGMSGAGLTAAGIPWDRE